MAIKSFPCEEEPRMVDSEGFIIYWKWRLPIDKKFSRQRVWVKKIGEFLEIYFGRNNQLIAKFPINSLNEFLVNKD